MPTLYSMSEVMRKCGVTARTLKYYEEIGLLRSHRNQLNRRVYDDAAIEVLKQILWMKKTGIPLKMIKSIFQTNNQAEIMKIIERQKALLSSEMHRLTDMRGQIEVYMDQVLQGDGAIQEIWDRCVPKQITEIVLSDMQTVNSVEEDELAEDGIAWPKEIDSPPQMLHQAEDDREIVAITGSPASVFTAKEYPMPISLYITAKATRGNLWLFFGRYRLVFFQKDGQSQLLFHDHFLGCECNIPLNKPFPTDTYVVLQWVLRQELVVLYLNGQRVFTLDYAHYDDYTLTSQIGVGTDQGDTVFVRDLGFTEIDKYERHPIPLADLWLRQNERYMQGEELVLFSALDREMAGTQQAFSLPLKIDLEAKTTDCNIRLAFHKGSVILNWEKDRQRMPCRDVFTGELTVLESGGYLAAQEYHAISWILHTDFCALIVDGVCRFYLKKEADEQVSAAPLRDIVRIGTAFGSTMTVRRLTVTELEKNS